MVYIGSNNPGTIVVLAVFMLGIAIVAKSWLDAQPEVVAEDVSSATVLSIDGREAEYRDKVGNKNVISLAIAKLQLADGKTFTASIPKPYPAPGDRVSVKVIEYSDGSTAASFFR